MNITPHKLMQCPVWLERGMRVIAACIVSLSLAIFCSGCHSWQKSHESAVAQFGQGDIEVARTALQESQEKLRSEKKLLELDLGILDLASGNATQAEARFRTMRRELEHLEQKDITEQAQLLAGAEGAV